MSLRNSVPHLKGEAVKYWQAQPVNERLTIATWDNDLGIIYHGIVRIYIDQAGRLYANKPTHKPGASR